VAGSERLRRDGDVGTDGRCNGSVRSSEAALGTFATVAIGDVGARELAQSAQVSLVSLRSMRSLYVTVEHHLSDTAMLARSLLVNDEKRKLMIFWRVISIYYNNCVT
jgi:alanine dehydrogenase